MAKITSISVFVLLIIAVVHCLGQQAIGLESLPNHDVASSAKKFNTRIVRFASEYDVRGAWMTASIAEIGQSDSIDLVVALTNAGHTNLTVVEIAGFVVCDMHLINEAGRSIDFSLSGKRTCVPEYMAGSMATPVLKPGLTRQWSINLARYFDRIPPGKYKFTLKVHSTFQSTDRSDIEDRHSATLAARDLRIIVR